MILHAESSGSGPDVVILHGLMGSCENWRSVRKILAGHYRVACLDLPNHGRSPHVAQMEARAIGKMVLSTLDAFGMNRAVVVGHSLGGKIAMQMASEHADRLAGVAVVDISPRAFQPMHLFILRACQQLDLVAAVRRVDLDHALAASVPHAETRAFLLKNVVRDPKGRWAWRVPLQTLIDNYRVVSDAPPLVAPYNGPTLFVAGECSPFRIRDDESLIRSWFPAVRWVTIPNAGHLVHADQPEAFTAALAGFLGTCYPSAELNQTPSAEV
ncbi:MAG TPA: alpha/beta fold hydrolase [Kiritimatiellia bacterium]|jgi:esterase|nr:alpha/beta fold hydrolase [Kiritimatiellia bacterium]HOM58902.1 alpha/beta fold hydrolase [Kiritimatiellia bacterium]HOR98343.1 alpha/beta fold hydrolase [Kiritimatiellia bacterium]HPK38045.1 alpha/beta fold hydrolase [Kiritimatiellia bacterium]